MAVIGHEKVEGQQTIEMEELSERLATVLVWSLESTVGPQQSIVVNRKLGAEDGGISMWADLIRHFEKGSTDLRKVATKKAD